MAQSSRILSIRWIRPHINRIWLHPARSLNAGDSQWAASTELTGEWWLPEQRSVIQTLRNYLHSILQTDRETIPSTPRSNLVSLAVLQHSLHGERRPLIDARFMVRAHDDAELRTTIGQRRGSRLFSALQVFFPPLHIGSPRVYLRRIGSVFGSNFHTARCRINSREQCRFRTNSDPLGHLWQQSIVPKSW